MSTIPSETTLPRTIEAKPTMMVNTDKTYKGGTQLKPCPTKSRTKLKTGNEGNIDTKNMPSRYPSQKINDKGELCSLLAH